MAKTATKNKNTDVIELEAIEELPLDKKIENTLVKHNVTEAVIAGLKEKYSGLVLRSVDNKEDYLEIKAAKKEVRKYGILTEQICKKGREDAIAIQKKWLSKEKEILGKIAEVEDPLEAEIDKYEKEQERLEIEAARKRENAFAARQSELIKMGAVYMDGFYSLNHVSFESDTIKTADQDIWESSILPKYKAQYEKNEAARVEEERKQKEAAESLRIAQEAMAQKQKEMEEWEAKLKQAEEQRLSAIRQQQEAEELIKREEQRRIAEAADRERRERIDKRINQLRALGMNYISNNGVSGYTFEGVTALSTQIESDDDAKWDSIIEYITPAIGRLKIHLEEEKETARKEQLRIAEEAAAQRERDRIALEQKQAQEKADREAAAKAEEALKATDKTKWQYFIASIGNIVVPEMKSPTYRAKVEEATKLAKKIVNL
jgi:hypothetical protein